jgi:hypothetical protein
MIKNKIFVASFFLNAITFNIFPVQHVPWHLLFIKIRYLPIVFSSFAIISTLFMANNIGGEFLHIQDFIKYYIYFLAALIPLMYSLEIIENIRKFSRGFFWFLCVLAIVQFSDILIIIDPLFSLLNAKFTFSSVGGQYRGVSLIETEQARASFLLIMTYLIGYWNDNQKTPLLIMFVIVALLIRSVTGIALILSIFSILFLGKVKIQQLTLYFLTLLILLIIYINIYPASKISNIFYIFQTKDLSTAFDYLSSMSGGRVSSIVSAINDIVNNMFMPKIEYSYLHPETSKLDIYRNYGFTNTVPNSTLLYHLRILGFTMIFLIVFAIYYHLNLRSTIRFIFSRGFLIFLLIGIIYSPPGTPLLFIFFMTQIYSYKDLQRIKI